MDNECENNSTEYEKQLKPLYHELTEPLTKYPLDARAEVLGHLLISQLVLVGYDKNQFIAQVSEGWDEYEKLYQQMK
jgi:hypothetical protein